MGTTLVGKRKRIEAADDSGEESSVGDNVSEESDDDEIELK